MNNVIGSLRYRVTLEAPTRTAEDGGAAAVTWAAVGNMFAQVKPISGREIVSADGLSGRVSHEVWIRHGVEVRPEMRFVEGSRVLLVLAALDVDGRRRWLKCLCEERRP